MAPTLSTTIGEFIWNVEFHSKSAAALFNAAFPYLNTEPPSENPGLTIKLEDGFGTSFQDYEPRTSVDEAGRTSHTRADYELTIDSSFEAVLIRVYDGFALKHACMHLFSLYALHRQWGLLMHASVVRSGMSAHLFGGHSGAGKSTAAALSAPRGLYADEAALVKITDDQVIVYHSPFRSELHTPLADQLSPCPLASINMLHQSPVNRREPVSRPDAVMALMAVVFYWSPSPEDAKSIMRLLGTFSRLVPVYHLYFRKEPTFWELID
ncbi:hypothetical protein [Paenibacillus soyae]|uniref:Phosphoenolpyruvate carboxykinase n=1 Tax=Paenibacillus soyae TaxID=2969249 RepID=A0A9X2SBN1_9BACL|nr:hypothetical protein [Paenibacillus soyae]MCR2807411.1 hypothetical protein [Paenibacillus soyae]